MTRDQRREYRRLLRIWRHESPLVPPVPAQRQSTEGDGERMATTQELAAIHPDAGKGWDARRIAEGERF